MKLSRRTLLKAGLPLLLAGLGGGAYSALGEPHRLSVERVVTPIPGLPTALEGFRIAVLSDFHLHPFTKIEHIRNAVKLTNDLRPDLVVLLGDFVDASADAIFELAPELARLNAKLGIYSVLGNHDHWKGPDIVREGLEAVGIPVLQNRGIALPVNGANGHELFLAGLDSAWCGHPDISAALATLRGNLPTILLIHEPDFADTAAKDGRIALQLSGHSHGGQVRLPFIGALELPSWGSRYDHGLYQVGKMLHYTNRGLGVVDIPVRFNCVPEITEIILASGPAAAHS